MPNPTQSDLHVNVPLTNVVRRLHAGQGDVHRGQGVPAGTGPEAERLYWKYSKSDWRRTDAQKRAPGTESAGVGWKVDTGQYFAEVWAVHKDIDDQVRANADSNWRLDSDATKFVTNQLLLRRDLDWNDKYFKTGQWGTDLTGVTGTVGAGQFLQWSDAELRPDRAVHRPADELRGAVWPQGQHAGPRSPDDHPAEEPPGHHRPDQVHPAWCRDHRPARVAVRRGEDPGQLRDGDRRGRDQRREGAGRGGDLPVHVQLQVGAALLHPELAVPDDAGRRLHASPGTGTWLATPSGSG